MRKNKLIKIMVIVIMLALLFAGCSNKNNENGSSESESSDISNDVSEESSIAENVEKEHKNLKYTVLSTWDVTENGDTVQISVDNNKANILLSAKEDDKASEYTQGDLQSNLLYVLEQTAAVEDTTITSDAIVDGVKIMDIDAAYINFDINMQGVEGKIILYTFVHENYVYSIEYSSLLEDAEEYVKIFDDFVENLKLKE